MLKLAESAIINCNNVLAYIDQVFEKLSHPCFPVKQTFNLDHQKIILLNG
jgi:hypothetical protein